MSYPFVTFLLPLPDARLSIVVCWRKGKGTKRLKTKKILPITRIFTSGKGEVKGR